MREIRMTDETWARLLSAKRGETRLPEANSAAFALYAPLASASGRFVLAQIGQSLDGRVATPCGDARDISGPDGIAHLHRCRALVDAVIVGIGTVKADNPRLSVRSVEGDDPVRVVIDCQGELTGEEGLFHDDGAPVIVITSESAPRRVLPNAELVAIAPDDCKLDPRRILDALSQRGLHRILVEGGGRTIARFINAGLVDHLHVTIAPLIIGSGPMGLSLPPIEQLTSAIRPATKVYFLGSDTIFDCSLRAAQQAVIAA